ncbi:adhesion G-protein coupled receptor F3 [Pholidichthys leucotaenia]
MMVESNVTLEGETLLEVLNSTSKFQVTSESLENHEVIIETSELVAECLLTADDTNCSCSSGFVWSNAVCDQYQCCREEHCTGNVSYTTPLCIPKVDVRISGSVHIEGTWTSSHTITLENEFEALNAMRYVNVTSYRSSLDLINNIADFEVAVNAEMNSSKLQEILTALQSNLSAQIFVDTKGLVTIEGPEDKVCYKSTPEITCTFDEDLEPAAWTLTKENMHNELNNGIVVQLSHSCTNTPTESCSRITLKEVTSLWAGTYECAFSTGSIRHTASIELQVSQLPDEIPVVHNPLTIDCSSADLAPVSIEATVPNTTEDYTVWWSNVGVKQSDVTPTTEGTNLVYSVAAEINCKDPKVNISITFKNTKEQEKTVFVNIPVVKAGDIACPEELFEGQVWPKTPDGETAVNQSCPPGRVGNKSRTCKGNQWKPVFPACIDEALNKLSDTADNFLKGLGASQEVALHIFEGVKNSSLSFTSESSDNTADISSIINVFTKMEKASEQTELNEDTLPDVIGTTSNIVNISWTGVENEHVHHMAGNLLVSLEGLVKNIKVNTSKGENKDIISENLHFKVCTVHPCNTTVFGTEVKVNTTTSITYMGVKNLMPKLNNNFKIKSTPHSALLSATVKFSDTPLQSKILFRKESNSKNHFCVYWDVSEMRWSDDGCVVSSIHDNGTICSCSHLTAFSVLMAEGAIGDPVLDIISNVGLGVSICSLLIFLIIEYLVWQAVVKTNLSHYRHTAIVNIAVFLLLGNISFLAASEPETISDTVCFVLTICRHLSYLAMFCWMLCMSTMLVHQLIFVFSPLRKRVFMYLSSILGYVCPILIVGSSYIYYKYTKTDYYSKDTCWLVFDSILVGSMHAFLLPVGTITLANLFSMVVVIVTLLKTSVPDSSKADDKETAKGILKVVLFLTPVFGITWIIGFVQLILGNDHPYFKLTAYIFTILNSFQGLFLLITGAIAESKVREELIKLIRGQSRGTDNSTKKLTSTMYTGDK